MPHQKNNSIRNAILGLATGDALGVPVEFETREYLKENPVTDMMGYGTFNQPPGTWSDDTSLALCLLEVMGRNLTLQEVASNFQSWLFENKFTPHGEVFDVGNGTLQAINRLREGVAPEKAGSTDEYSNGNGSLMRILPLVFHLKQIEEKSERFKLVQNFSSITHGHIRSSLACFYYLEFASFLCEGKTPAVSYDAANASLVELAREITMASEELQHFDRVLNKNIAEVPEEDIHSSGYVIDTLEASIWCLLNRNSYREAVLKAVNLGMDTDTTAAVTGGLAGLHYGAENIPSDWLAQLAGLDEIEKMIVECNLEYS